MPRELLPKKQQTTVGSKVESTVVRKTQRQEAGKVIKTYTGASATSGVVGPGAVLGASASAGLAGSAGFAAGGGWAARSTGVGLPVSWLGPRSRSFLLPQATQSTTLVTSSARSMGSILARRIPQRAATRVAVRFAGTSDRDEPIEVPHIPTIIRECNRQARSLA